MSKTLDIKDAVDKRPITAWTPFIPHKPHKKQALFLLLNNHLEVGYGGSAGPGKSSALLMAALQYVDVPGYSAIIFRKTLTDLMQPSALLSRAMEWLSPWFPHVKYDPSKHSFRFPSGARLEFGYMGEFRSEERYQGAEYQFVGFDEATQHFEEDYLYLFSRLRHPICDKHPDKPDYHNCSLCRQYGPLLHVPLRMRSATNPGSIGHKWYKNRFGIVFNKELKAWVGSHPGRPFVPARFTDNPHIDHKQYRKGLENLDALTRAMLLDGDWGASQDARFKYQWACFYERKAPGRSLYESGGDYFILHKRDGSAQVFHSANLIIFQTYDFASSQATGVNGMSFKKDRPASWTVLSTWAVTPTGDLLWLDIDRFQGESPEILSRARKSVAFWRPQMVVCEMNGPGAPITQLLTNMGIPTVPLFQDRDKIANANEAQVRMEFGRVFLPREIDAPAMRKQVDDEVFTWVGMPQENDDIVDTLSNAAHQVVSLRGNDYTDSTISQGQAMADAWDTNVVMPFGNPLSY